MIVASTVPGFVAIAVGLVLVYAGAAELLGYLRARRRLEGATAVVVDRVEVSRGMSSANAKSYAARFRFRTRDGRTVEAVSSLNTFPGPAIGREITVTYDPARPETTAERRGVRGVKVVLAPVIVAAGAILAGYGVTQL